MATSQYQSRNTNISGLAQYLLNELYFNWFNEREQIIQPKWNRNHAAFKCISTDFWKSGEAESWRSDTFVPITKIKTITAYSVVIDMLLQTTRFPFSLVQSPFDGLVMGKYPPNFQDDLEQNIQDMESLIHQQLQDCNADLELMKCVLSAAIYGETFAKRYIHEVKRNYYEEVSYAPEGFDDTEGQFTTYEKRTKNVLSPGMQYVSVWDVVRDLEVDDPRKGVGIFFNEAISAYELRLKQGLPYFIDANIDTAIDQAEDPGTTTSPQDTASEPPRYRDLDFRHKTIQYREYWGRIPLKIAEDFEKDMENKTGFVSDTDFENDGKEVEVTVTLADDEVVRYSRMNPEETRPVYRTVWELDLDGQGAIGVPDNVESLQTVLNGAVRTYEDNKKLSANVMLALKPGMVKDWDKGFEPGKSIEINKSVSDVREAIQQIMIADVGESLLNLISLMERYADEASQIPKIQQGVVANKQKPDTLGEMQMLQQNAGKYIGGILKNFDEGLIEPIITDFFEFNMDDPDIDSGKGNFIAKALGFSSFQDRVTRLEKLMRALQLALSNELLASETNLRKLQEEIYKSLDIDPQVVLKTEEEKAQDAQEAQAAQEAAMEQQRVIQAEAMANELKMEAGKTDIQTQGKIAEDDNKAQNDIVLETIAGGKKS